MTAPFAGPCNRTSSSWRGPVFAHSTALERDEESVTARIARNWCVGEKMSACLLKHLVRPRCEQSGATITLQVNCGFRRRLTGNDGSRGSRPESDEGHSSSVMLTFEKMYSKYFVGVQLAETISRMC